MATSLPAATDFTGAAVTEAEFKTAITNLRAYLAELLGADSSRSTSGHKNLVIGGDFSTNPWQRGTSFTGPATGAYTADRWKIEYVTAGVVNVLKTADAPAAASAGVYSEHCLHVDVTTADASIAATDYMYLEQRLEGNRVRHLGFGIAGTRYVTLSFWVKSGLTGTHCVALVNSAGGRSYIATYTVSVADTWEFKTVTMAVDTTGTWVYDTGIGLSLRFALAAGSNFHGTAGAWTTGAFATSAQVNLLSSTANNFKIALVQLEGGNGATPFETRDAAEELRLARRYLPAFQSSGSTDYLACAGFAASSTTSRANFIFSVQPRVPPTGISVSSAAHFTVNQGGTTVACNSVTFSAAGLTTCRVNYDVASGLTTGAVVDIYANSASGQILFTGSEL